MLNYKSACLALTQNRGHIVSSSLKNFSNETVPNQVIINNYYYYNGYQMIETEFALIQSIFYRQTSLYTSDKSCTFTYNPANNELTSNRLPSDDLRVGVLLNEIVKLILLGEINKNNLIIPSPRNYGYRHQFRRDDVTGEVRENRVEYEVAQAAFFNEIKRIVFDEGKSMAISLNYDTIVDALPQIEDKFKEFGYTVITRFRDNTVDDLRSFYGENFILKLSKFCYYVNGKGFIYMYKESRYEVGNPARAENWDKDISSRSCERWLLNNREYLISMIHDDDIKALVNKLIDNQELSNEVAVILNKYVREIIHASNKNLIASRKAAIDTALGYQPGENNSFSSAKEYIKSHNASINSSLKSANQHLCDLRAQSNALDEGLQGEAVNPEAKKAIALLERMKRTGLVRDYILDINKSKLIIHTEWLRQRFVEIGNLNKRYLNTCIKESYRSLLSQQRNNCSVSEEDKNKYCNERSEYIKSMINYEDKYYFAVMPATIVLSFAQEIHHGFGYEYFQNESEVTNEALRNGHSRYFGTNVEYGRLNLRGGCLGSSENLFRSAGAEYSLTKYISLCIQYLQTFIPLDSGGDFSLVYNPIIDNDGKVVSYLGNVKMIGKYINNEFTEEGQPFIDKTEEVATETEEETK